MTNKLIWYKILDAGTFLKGRVASVSAATKSFAVTRFDNPDFSKYAKLCGSFGIRVTEKDELENAMNNIFEYDGPAMIDIIKDPLLT